jgi:hypothetical protein
MVFIDVVFSGYLLGGIVLIDQAVGLFELAVQVEVEPVTQRRDKLLGNEL